MALDLGGTNFRVLLIQLQGNEVKMENRIFPISKELMVGHGSKVILMFYLTLGFYGKGLSIIGTRHSDLNRVNSYRRF